jgi:hypothetical protein
VNDEVLALQLYHDSIPTADIININRKMLVRIWKKVIHVEDIIIGFFIERLKSTVKAVTI